MRVRASRTTTSAPRLRSSRAQDSPATPAPTTTTDVVSISAVPRDGKVGRGLVRPAFRGGARGPLPDLRPAPHKRPGAVQPVRADVVPLAPRRLQRGAP